MIEEHCTDFERDEAIKLIRAFGGDKIAKSIRGKLSGYSRRAQVETTFSRNKKMFGGRTFSRTQERIVLEKLLDILRLGPH